MLLPTLQAVEVGSNFTVTGRQGQFKHHLGQHIVAPIILQSIKTQQTLVFKNKKVSVEMEQITQTGISDHKSYIRSRVATQGQTHQMSCVLSGLCF